MGGERGGRAAFEAQATEARPYTTRGTDVMNKAVRL